MISRLPLAEIKTVWPDAQMNRTSPPFASTRFTSANRATPRASRANPLMFVSDMRHTVNFKVYATFPFASLQVDLCCITKTKDKFDAVNETSCGITKSIPTFDCCRIAVPIHATRSRRQAANLCRANQVKCTTAMIYLICSCGGTGRRGGLPDAF